MARTPTTSDVFSAIAEPRRRVILEYLCEEERAVNDVVESLGMSQPVVSKHLRVLREVGLVQFRQSGRQKLYRVNGKELQAVHEWTKAFEHFWDHQLDQIKIRAEREARCLENKCKDAKPQ